jgi:hypothetical protein
LPYYLLSSRALYDIAVNQDKPAVKWFKRYRNVAQAVDALYISSVARVHLLKNLDQRIASRRESDKREQDSVLALRAIRENVLILLEWFREKKLVLSMDEGIADIWSDLLHEEISFLAADSDSKPISVVEKIELATAIHGTNGIDLVYVIDRQPSLDFVPGVRVENLSSIA